jgi:lipopolysaccharide export system permease protein
MRTSLTLSNYLGKQFLIAMGGVFCAFASVAFLLDFVELLRRSQSKDEATINVMLAMSLYKLPTLAQQVLPFAILFGGMLAFWRLTRNQELVVVRAAGVSVWQFIFPGLLVALVIGMLKITTLNPIASAMLFHYQELENKYLKGKTSILAVSETGLWLRQMDPAGESIVHAIKVNPRTFELSDVIIFLFTGVDHFTARVDASAATLKGNYWELRNAWITAPDQPARFEKAYKLRTELTLEQIQDSFASPESISFWDLPRFIYLLQKAGFSALRQRLYFDQLLADPFLLCAMVLIAATFSLRHHRRGGAVLIILAGVVTGFVVYFVSDVVLALGLASTIPVPLAAWTPAGASLLLGLASLFHIEDG